MKKALISVILVFCLACNYGCVEILAAGALTGAGEYIKYTKNNDAHRTFTGSQNQVIVAATNALKKIIMIGFIP